ncbi:hypothetical protein B0H19DRAFT_1058278 [Mycena capillaripes]|nr:hypothetical protein B0H19DRAFT_1058278 [Mycena capillaripes]
MGFSITVVYLALLSLSGLVSAALVQHTIDDHDSAVVYSTPPVRCQGAAGTNASCSLAGYDENQLINGTLSRNVAELEVTFTGTALLVFLGVVPVESVVFTLDGEFAGTFSIVAASAHLTLGDQSLVYKNATLPYGTHTFQIVSQGFLGFDFDGIMYSSDDGPASDVPTPSGGTSSAASTGTSSVASTPTSDSAAAASSSTVGGSPQKKLGTAAIAAAVLGILVGLIVLLLIIFFLVRRRTRGRNDGTWKIPVDEENISYFPMKVEGIHVAAANITPQDIIGSRQEEVLAPREGKQDPSLAEQIRILQGQLQAALQRDSQEFGRASTTTSSETVAGPSVMRSISTMKRPRLHIRITDEELGVATPDSLVHRDSGRRLESERHVEEPPPMYEK